jgi:hypothetical protein
MPVRNFCRCGANAVNRRTFLGNACGPKPVRSGSASKPDIFAPPYVRRSESIEGCSTMARPLCLRQPMSGNLRGFRGLPHLVAGFHWHIVREAKRGIAEQNCIERLEDFDAVGLGPCQRVGVREAAVFGIDAVGIEVYLQ